MQHTSSPSAASPTTGEEKPASRASLAALRPILPFALRYKGRIFTALVALVVASAATLTVPVAVRRMIDFGFNAEGAGLINAYFAAMIAIVVVLALASATRFYSVTTLGERVVADLRDALFRHLTVLDVGFFDTVQSGDLLSRLTADTTQLKSAFGVSASVALRNLFLFIGAVAMMVVTSPKLSALVLVVIPVIVLPLVAAGRAVRGRSRLAQDRLAAASAFASESIGAIRTMQAFGAERRTADRFKEAAEAAFAGARATARARAVLTFVAIFLAFSSVVAVLWLGAQDVLLHRMTGGALSQFVLYAVFGAASLGELSEVWSELSAAAGAAGRIAEILEAKPRIVGPARPLAPSLPVKGEVVFDNVTFTYPSRTHEAVVQDLALSVRPGETLALVGPSGAGKSTLIQLMLRFYDPSAGRILLDGIDIRAMDPAALRALVALVPQDPVIFAGSIEDNIRYGRPAASDADVREAAKKAAVEGFVRQLPEGYATRVGERGVTLSGGQRQRLAIARAILKDAPVLLLDEATSALDAENETLVQAALEAVRHNRTTLVIAHRLATVLSADRIVVMDGGRIVEEGTHASLVARQGLYSRLARLQFETGTAKAAE